MKSVIDGNVKFLFRFAFVDIFKIKKILLICLFVLSNFAMAQNDSDNPYLYESNNEISSDETFPGSPGNPNPVPIDDYTPILFVLGAAFAIRYSFKKKANVE